MCGSGNVVGSTFEELRDIIALVEDKSRVGVCIDTCHAFAAGYDLREPEAFAKTMEQFDDVVGLKYLRALHCMGNCPPFLSFPPPPYPRFQKLTNYLRVVNDSKAPLGSHRDLHANIGTGFIGLRGFHSVMNYDPFQNLPMVLETPIDAKGANGKTVENKQVWADEIKLLESLIGMDTESDLFKAEERRLRSQGADERKKIEEQVDRKAGKDAKKK